MPVLKENELQVLPIITSEKDKQPAAKLLIYPKKDALERRFDATFGEGKWSWYLAGPGVWTLECGGSKQSVPEDPVEASRFSVNTYNKMLFCRAARNLGFGRELETSPEIWVFSDDKWSIRFESGKERWSLKEHIVVKKIEVKDGFITALTLVKERDGAVVFSYKEDATAKASTPAATADPECSGDGTPLAQVGREIAEQAKAKAEEAKAKKAAEKKKKAEKPPVVEVEDVPTIIPTTKFESKPEEAKAVDAETKTASVTVEPEQLSFDNPEPVVVDEGLDDLIGELANELSEA